MASFPTNRLLKTKLLYHYIKLGNCLMFQHVCLLLKDKGLLMKHLNPLCNPWSEINFHALGCLEEIIINKSNNHCLSDKFTYLIKDIIFRILSLLPYNDDKLYYSKVCNLFFVQFKRYICIHISSSYLYIYRS